MNMLMNLTITLTNLLGEEGLTVLAGLTAANDVDPNEDPDRALDEDPAFQSVCDARRDAWIEAMEFEAMDEEPAGTASRAGG